MSTFANFHALLDEGCVCLLLYSVLWELLQIKSSFRMAIMTMKMVTFYVNIPQESKRRVIVLETYSLNGLDLSPCAGRALNRTQSAAK